MEILDTHVHLFDITRPGLPWPSPGNAALFRTADAARLRKLAEPHGVRGAIAVECSPRPEDNDWLLAEAARDPFIVGVVANLEPGTPRFRTELERLSANPLLVGIRSGNLWGRDFRAMVGNAAAIADLALLAQRGLSLDVANPDLPLLESAVHLAAQLPALRLVIDHLPGFDEPKEPDGRERYRRLLELLAAQPNVYLKISSVLRRLDGHVVTNPGFYVPRLDRFWNLFAPERLLFASDWPNSDTRGTYGEVFGAVDAYLESRPEPEKRAFFRGNALQVYGKGYNSP